MAADVLVRNAWYVAGLSHEFPPQQLQGQIRHFETVGAWMMGVEADLTFV